MKKVAPNLFTGPLPKLNGKLTVDQKDATQALGVLKATTVEIASQSTEQLAPYPETRVQLTKLDESDPRLLAGGYWLGAHVENDVYWPDTAHSIVFEGVTLFVLPAKLDAVPAVFVNGYEAQRDELTAKISRFLSAWSWMEGRGVRVIEWLAGGRPFRFQNSKLNKKTTVYDFEHLPEVLSKEAALALAFFREGLSLDHEAYSFLSFYKVINSHFSGKNEQRNWIRDNVESLRDREALKRLDELAPTLKGQKIQDYIWVSCRNAIAHSHPDSIVVNPDEQTDIRRIRSDLPIIKALAKRLINAELGVLTAEDIWDSKEHRLAGARWMVGEAVLRQILAGDHVPRRKIRLPKKINLRVRQKKQYTSLENLEFKVESAGEQLVYFEICSQGQLFRMVGALHFGEGEIAVDLLNGVRVDDDGSIWAANLAADSNEFLSELFANGRLQIIASADERLVAESKPIIPMNMFFDHERSKAITDHWLNEVRIRSDAANST